MFYGHILSSQQTQTKWVALQSYNERPHQSFLTSNNMAPYNTLSKHSYEFEWQMLFKF